MSSPYWLIFLSLSLRGYESEFGCGDWSELKPWQLRGVREVVEFELELVNEICMYIHLFLCRLAMIVFFIIINLIFLIFYLKAEKKGGCKGSFLAICKRDKAYSNIILRNWIELRQNRYLSILRLSNLSPFGNLSHGGLFLVTSFSGIEGLWILRVQSLETLDSNT